MKKLDLISNAVAVDTISPWHNTNIYILLNIYAMGNCGSLDKIWMLQFRARWRLVAYILDMMLYCTLLPAKAQEDFGWALIAGGMIDTKLTSACRCI